MKKDWLIYAAITGGVIAVVYIVKSAATGVTGGIGAAINSAAQTFGNAAGTGAAASATGFVTGVGQSIGNDLSEDIDAVDPYQGVQLVNGPGTAQYNAAQAYAAAGYPGD
jgi:hypothetical protein